MTEQVTARSLALQEQAVQRQEQIGRLYKGALAAGALVVGALLLVLLYILLRALRLARDARELGVVTHPMRILNGTIRHGRKHYAAL